MDVLGLRWIVIRLARCVLEFVFFFQAEDGIRDYKVTGVQTCALPISALNTPIEQASANVFLAVLRDTLAGPPGSSDLLLPRVDLSRLFPEPAAEFVKSHGGEIRLRTTIHDLSELKFDAVIVAVGPHQLKQLLPDHAPEYSYQPIYTCYLQYPERVKLPFPMLGLAEGLVQWVFDRGALTGERGRLAGVISAQGAHQQMTHDELADTCARELARAFPTLPAPQWSRVIAEKRATIACTPGLTRPSVETAMPGVFIAGDYVEPDYPPTLEAAVRSGLRAVHQSISLSRPLTQSVTSLGRSTRQKTTDDQIIRTALTAFDGRCDSSIGRPYNI